MKKKTLAVILLVGFTNFILSPLVSAEYLEPSSEQRSIPEKSAGETNSNFDESLPESDSSFLNDQPLSKPEPDPGPLSVGIAIAPKPEPDPGPLSVGIAIAPKPEPVKRVKSAGRKNFKKNKHVLKGRQKIGDRHF